MPPRIDPQEAVRVTVDESTGASVCWRIALSGRSLCGSAARWWPAKRQAQREQLSAKPSFSRSFWANHG